MMRPNDAGTVPFEMGLDAAILTFTDKIISSENDLLGVCFYGTVRPRQCFLFIRVSPLAEREEEHERL